MSGSNAVDDGTARPRIDKVVILVKREKKKGTCKGSYLEMNLSVVVDPSDDHVSPDASLVLGKSKTNVAERFHLHFKCDILVTRCPEDEKIIVEYCTVPPFDAYAIPE